MVIKSTSVAKTIAFDSVLTLNFYWFPATGFILGIILFFLYAEYGFDYLGIWGLFFTGLLLLFIIHLLIKHFSKNIRLNFTDDTLEINVNGQRKVVDKKDVVGLFAPDYESSRSSLVSLQLFFKNGETLEISDSKFTEMYDDSINQKLTKDLKVILNELGFSKIRYGKSRAFKKQEAYWYSTC